MRLLHTSDWHFGRSFHREDMLGAQAAFVDWLVGVVRCERVDAVLISGDLYDRALPPVDAVRLASEALGRLVDAGAHVVLISGNHDSAHRLGFGAGLLDAAGVHVRTDPSRVGEPVLLGDNAGPVAIYPIPYLEPDAVRDEFDGVQRSHSGVLTAAMDRVRSDLAVRPAGTRSVALAHAFVTGGHPCESERDITIGGVASVPATTFAGVDYMALGHLHGAQRVGASTASTGAIRYAGSPLAYSFSEATQTKSACLVELSTAGLVAVDRLEAPVPRPLAILRGRLDELVADPALADRESHYLSVTLTDPVRPREPMERLRSRFPHTLLLTFEPEGGAERGAASYAARIRGQDDLTLAAGFVEHVRGGAPSQPELALLTEAFETGHRAERAA